MFSDFFFFFMDEVNELQLFSPSLVGLLLCAVRGVFLFWKQGLLNLQSSELLPPTSLVI